jgi:FKBP-type peptidyl-prolyl cis-trans isomerase
MLKASRIIIALLLGFTLIRCQKDIENPNAEQFKKDRKLMDDYIAANSWQGAYLTQDIYKQLMTQGIGTAYPKNDEGIVIGFVTQLLDGTVIDTVYQFYQHNQGFYPSGWEFGVGTMTKGEYSRFLLASYYWYGGESKVVNNVTVPANSVIRIDAKVNDIVAVENIPMALADQKGLSAQKTGTGLVYAITTPGSDTEPKITNGQTVTVKYKGYLLNDFQFDSSNSFSFVAGASGLIEGWKEGMQYLRKGDKATLVVPASLAYGPSGSYNSQGKLIIPPNAVIAFDIEVLEVK